MRVVDHKGKLAALLRRPDPRWIAVKQQFELLRSRVSNITPPPPAVIYGGLAGFTVAVLIIISNSILAMLLGSKLLPLPTVVVPNVPRRTSRPGQSSGPTDRRECFSEKDHFYGLDADFVIANDTAYTCPHYSYSEGSDGVGFANF